MEATFERNRKKIGDESFEYDVQVDFGGEGDGKVESCEWDDDDDGDGDF